MIESKPWDWKKVDNEDEKNIWREPSMETYYLADRWTRQKKKQFLDIGCGLGRHTIFFAKKGFSVSSIDLSKDAIEETKKWAQKENIKIESIVNCDMLDIPYQDNSFDCILCRNVISHTDTEGMKKIINKIFKLLKENGECFLTLGSKNASTYKDKNNPKIDKNTAIRMDEGPEKGVPHFYADMEIIPELFKNFSIEYISQVQDFKQVGTEFKSFWHYLLLIKKVSVKEPFI